MSPGDDGRGIRESDVRAMLQYASDLASFERPEEFHDGALPGLRELVACDVATYNEVEFEAGRMVAAEARRGR